jgi:hypothetical protein
MDTLRSTSLMLIALPKTIADSGHSDDMQDLWLDRVRAEAQRSMARAEMADRRRNQVGAVALVARFNQFVRVW